MKYWNLAVMACCLFFLSACGSDAGNENGGVTPADPVNDTAPAESDSPTPEPELSMDEESAAPERKEGGVLIQLTTGANDPYSVCLALATAADYADTYDVMVYFDQRSVDVVTKGAKDLAYNPFPSVDEQITALSAKGVRLRACAPCLKAAFKSESDLRSEVKAAKPGELASFASGKILSLNY